MSEKDVNAKEFRGRFDPVLHRKIKCAAKDSFRSMTAEIVYRLAKSFETEPARAPFQSPSRSSHQETVR
jgi:hypothetical protein